MKNTRYWRFPFRSASLKIVDSSGQIWSSVRQLSAEIQKISLIDWVPDENGRGNEEDLDCNQVEDIDDSENSQSDEPHTKSKSIYPVMRLTTLMNMKMP